MPDGYLRPAAPATGPHDFAADLADRGIPTFPCLPTKAPATARGFHAANADPQHGDYGPDTLVGMPTGPASGFDVVDIDPRHGGDEWFESVLTRLPTTQIVHTRSGGLHIYLRAAPGLRSSAGRIAPGVDVRAAGGYVIRWDAHGGRTEQPGVIADWPDWLLAAARPPTASAPRTTGDIAAPSVQAVVELLDAMPNPESTDRDTYVRVMMAARGCCGAEDHADVAAAAVRWAARWPDSQGEEYETGRWEDDFSRRDAPLAGWPNLLASAARMGVDTSPWRAMGESGFAAAPAVAPGEAERLPEITEDAAVQAFARRFREAFVYDHTDKVWYEFDATRGWARDESASILRAIRGCLRDARVLWGEDGSKPAAKIAFASAVERGCQSDEAFAKTNRIWDADPLILGVPGGSIDLRTGAALPAAASHYILRRTAVAPVASAALAPTWQRFLKEATGDDASLQAWLQRLTGYALTGDVSEEMLAFFYGPGGNGKGVFLHTVASILGEYAYQAPAELFQAGSRVNREYQLARIDGIRLLVASETESGGELAESLVKEITGNEGKVNARHPYGRPFEFRSQAKLIIVGNHAPKLSGRSPAMERRLRVIPFDRTPAKPDPELKDKLVAEYPAILRWMIDGSLIWQRERLGTVPAIAAASQAYFAEQDSLSQWMAERCEHGADQQDSASALLDDFNFWLRGRGDKHVKASTFKESVLRVSGLSARHARTGSLIVGLKLRANAFPDIV